jgi:hypothetical protein
MRIWLAIPAVVGLFCMMDVGSGASFAEVRKGVRVITSPKVTINKALNAEECTTAGGSVTDVTYCNSGKACHTTDQSGKHHYVCLSKKQ